MERLEQRITELERRASRYRNALVLLLVGLCAVAVVGATTDDGIIEGKHLILTNDEGTRVVYSGSDVDGNGLMVTRSSTRKELMWAGAAPDGNGMLRVYSKAGERRIYLGSGASDNGLRYYK